MLEISEAQKTIVMKGKEKKCIKNTKVEEFKQVDQI